MAGKPAKACQKGQGHVAIMRAFIKAPQISSPSARITRYSLYETRSLRHWTSHCSGSRPLSAWPTRRLLTACSACSSWSTDSLRYPATTTLQQVSDIKSTFLDSECGQGELWSCRLSGSRPNRSPRAYRDNSTPRHIGRGPAGHPRSVRLGSGDNKTRLYTSIRSKSPRIAVQRSTAPVLHAEVMSLLAKGSVETVFPSSERVRLLQPLLPRPQERWWSKTHPRSQTSESRPYETTIQDDYIEADPLTNMPRGLIIFAGSERCLLSHPDSPTTTGGSWDSPLREWLSNKRSFPLGLSLLPTLLRSAWVRLFPRLRKMGNSTSWITSTTGSFWPSRRTKLLSHRSVLLSH